jgi:hypothetical protein
METLPRKSFLLYLNTNTGSPNLIDNTSTANVKWLIDWDSLFNRENYKYKHCQVRIRLVGENNITQETSTQSGVLVANFGQSFMGGNVPGVILAPIDITRSNIYETVSSITSWKNSNGYIEINTLPNAVGQNIDVPIGLNTFNLQMWRNGYGAIGDAENILVANTTPYYALLQFELY